jgi:hypothetical protein
LPGEGQRVRTCVGVGLVAVFLAVPGCSLFGKKQAAAPSAPKPQAAPNPTPQPNAPIVPTSARPEINGLLAGQVLDKFNRRPAGACIEITDLENTTTPAAAPINIWADGQGYFTIPGLEAGRHYRLVARVKDGDRLLSGVSFVTPPNPRLTIFVSEESTTPAVPPIPGPTLWPGREGGEKRPAAGIEPPVKTPAPAAAPAGPPGAAQPPQSSAPLPGQDRITDAGTKDQFDRKGPVPVDIPGPATQEVPPPPPPWTKSSDPPPGTAPAPPAAPGPAGPAPGVSWTGPTPVPSCVLVGRKLENFALYDINGQPWEFRKQRTGRLVLLDFWYSSCQPCTRAIQHLVKMDEVYRPYGLQIIGIAEESGPREQQVTAVRSVRGRLGMFYTTLLSDRGSCPVRAQFGVQAYPTLILLDESGEIVWRGEGPDERALYELKLEIHKRLGLRMN